MAVNWTVGAFVQLGQAAYYIKEKTLKHTFFMWHKGFGCTMYVKVFTGTIIFGLWGVRCFKKSGSSSAKNNSNNKAVGTSSCLLH